MGEQKEIQWSDNPQLLWNEVSAFPVDLISLVSSF